MDELKWEGPLLDCTGYATAGRSLCKAASVAGIAVQTTCTSVSSVNRFGLDEEILKEYERLRSTPIHDDATIVRSDIPPGMRRYESSKYSIGFTMFETTCLPKHWAPFCDLPDIIWTPSEYSKSSFVNAGVKTPIEVVKIPIDVSRFSPNGPTWKITNKRRFSFISVFDFTERKAWKELLRAYWTAFSSSDDVCLILKIYYGSFSDDSRAEIVRKTTAYREEIGMLGRAPVLIYGHDLANKDMPSLYRSADCYVGISREGYGLGFAEAMACGLACIGPEVGGNRAFMNNENSFLVKYLGDEPVSQGMIECNKAFEGLEWSVHSWEHLAEIMKEVVFNETKRKIVAKAGLEYVVNNIGLEQIGCQIKEMPI